MKWIRQNRLPLLLLFLISLVYFGLRVPNLTLQPIFADEAIYIRWAQVMRAEPTLRFLPLSDGKTPLFMWAMIPLFKLFDDPLLAGRFLSVTSGFATLLGVIFLGWRFFNQRVGLLGGFLYAVIPFFVFFDRMALVDSMLAAFTIWSLNVGLLLIQYPRFDLAMGLGYLLGGGLLVKPTGMASLLALPATLLTFPLSKKVIDSRIIKLGILWGTSLLIGFVIYNILRLGPGFSSLNTRNQDYVFLPSEIKDRIWDPFIPHLRDLADWWPKFLTWPVLIAVALGVMRVMWEKNRFGLAVLAWVLIPLLIQMTFLRTFTARYVLFSMPPLMILAAYALSSKLQVTSEQSSRASHTNKLFATTIMLIILSPLALWFDYQLLTNPETAPLPKTERRGYLEDWTAGYGFPEIAEFLVDKAKTGTVVVGTEGYFGTLPDGLQIYLEDHAHNPAVNKISVIGGKASVSAEVKNAALTHQTYFVANKSRTGESIPSGLKLLKEYPKAKSPDFPQDAILLFEVLKPIR